MDTSVKQTLGSVPLGLFDVKRVMPSPHGKFYDVHKNSVVLPRFRPKRGDLTVGH